MSSTSTDAAFAAARAANPEVMEREQLAAHVTDLHTIRAWVDAAEIAATRRGRQLAAQGTAGSPEATNTRVGQRSSQQAASVTKRAALCDQMPAFEHALTSGDISAGHLDAVANAARNLDETGQAALAARANDLVHEATTSSVDGFERSVRRQAKEITAQQANGSDADELDAQRNASTVKRWVDKRTGMHHTHLALDPLRDAEMWKAINTQLASDRTTDGNRRTPWAQMKVGAFLNAVKGATSNHNGSDGTSKAIEYRPEIAVLISYERLTNDAATAGVCETESGVPLPVSTVRRMCCDAHIYPVVLGTEGEVLDAGRTIRTANRQQRRALAAMHRTCVHPDCTVSFDACRIHHIKYWWEHLGNTNIDNLVPVCEQHHHLIHEGRWTLTMTPDRTATWTRPDGSIHWTGTTIDRTQPEPTRQRATLISPA